MYMYNQIMYNQIIPGTNTTLFEYICVCVCVCVCVYIMYQEKVITGANKFIRSSQLSRFYLDS